MRGKPDGLALSGWSRGGVALLAALALAGCEGGLGLGSGSPDATASAASAPAAGPTDVAAPEVFHVTEPGLWDGRPSLGGIWVAHPEVGDPERVRIVNTTNGQQIVGALFRRERDLPGPALQVSSEAAEALGMLAGAPATLDVTALRRQEAPAAPPPAPDAPAAAAPAESAPAPQAGGAEAVAQATAAILAGTPQAAPAAIATTALDAAAPAASALRYPFVQLATISTEAAANQAAQDLAAKGLPARVAAVPGGSAWRLLLGPATTEAQQATLRERAVAEGFADAYLVTS